MAFKRNGIPKGKSQRMFTKSAKSVHPKNHRKGLPVMRGGIRA